MVRKKRTSRVRPHRFYADREVPPDYKGNCLCRRCGLMGRPGDPHHPTDANEEEEFPPSPEDDRSSEILGEAG